MSFVTRQLNDSSDIISIHCLPLLDLQTKYIVIAKRHTIKVYYIDVDNTIRLRKAVPVWGTILDAKPFTPLETPGTWLIVTTELNKILLVGFKSSDKEVVIEEYNLSEAASSLSIEAGSLTVDSQKHFSFYTQEGSLCIYKLYRAGNLKNFQRAFEGTAKRTPKLFEDPEIHTITRTDRGVDRTPMEIIKIENHYEEGLHCSYSIVYRDDVYQYYSTIVTATSKDALVHGKALPLPEEVSPIIIPFERSLGVLIFGKSAIYLRLYESLVDDVSLGENLEKARDTTVTITDDDLTNINYISKSLYGKTWKVTAAVQLKRNIQETLTKILIVTSKGELYLSEIHYIVGQNKLGLITLELVRWSLKKFHKKTVTASHIIQINEDLFMLSSPKEGLRILEINWEKLSFTETFGSTHTPPVLDFNIAGTVSPKLQVVGGNDLDSGLIRTEFRGYDSVLNKLVSTEGSGITNFWKLNDTYIVSSFDGTKLLERNNDDFHPTTSDQLDFIDGAILEIIQAYNTEYIFTESGIYKEGESIKQEKISIGTVVDGEIIYVTNGTLKFKNESHKLTEEVSCISAVKFNKRIQVLVGTWDGSVILFSNGSKKVIQKRNSAIKSVIMKKSDKWLTYLIGDGHGNLGLINQAFDASEFNLGYSPVDIVDYEEDSIIAYNTENTVIFEFTNGLSVVKKGYLKVDAPEVLKCYNQQLFYLKNGVISHLDVSAENKPLKCEQKLNRLVTKSIKFKNHMELSIFVTITEKLNEVTGKMVVHSQLEVIDNNTLKLRSTFKLEPGIEVTDIVNTRYRKDLIDTYEEENIQLGYENVLSQCFVVSCIPHSRDEVISPLMLFTVDENGTLKYECSSPEAKVTFYTLTNHANRLVIGAGNTVAAYKVEYSVTKSKFALSRVSEYYQPRYFVSVIRSMGPDVLIGDVIQGAKVLTLKVIEESSKSLIFKFQEKTTTFERSYFLTAMEILHNLIIVADSLENISIQLLNDDGVEVVSRFNLGDKVNVIKRLDRSETILSKEILLKLFGENGDLEAYSALPKIVPVFLIGTVSGAIFLISLVIDATIVPKDFSFLKDMRPLAKNVRDRDMMSMFTDYRGFRTPNNMRSGLIERFIDGDMILSTEGDLKNYIEDYSRLL